MNNAFIFPGVGLGALVSEASETTDGMFLAAAECLARETSEGDLIEGGLSPSVARLSEVASRIAEAVVREARDSGVGRESPDDHIAAAIAAARWNAGDPLP